MEQDRTPKRHPADRPRTNFNFAVLHVPKEDEMSNDGHGNEVIVVTVGREALDQDLPEVDSRAVEPDCGH